ncbi:MAG: histidinol-phosphate transaminase [Oscillospiraceae bacterium]|nr:histidinol-phosphate transaminase [Oscillospiraceae bacterium]
MKTKSYLSKMAQQLVPYVPGIQPQESGWIKLNTNENPYPPSPMVADVLKSVDYSKLRLYPDSDSTLLMDSVANHLGIQDIQAENIFVGNGSDEVLALAFGAFYGDKKNVHIPDISYGFYPVWAQLSNVGVHTQSLDADFRIDPSKYTDSSGVILANPNAPTGIALTIDEVEKIVQQNPDGVILVDEAYIDFSKEQSAVSLVPKYDNVLVVRTFSKSHSLAGLRVGYAVGQVNLIEGLQRIKHSFNSYPLDMVAQICASASISDKNYWESTRQQIIQTREHTAASLKDIGYASLPSQTNFLLVHVPEAIKLYEFLLSNKILVRYWNKPRLTDFLRVTIGTYEEMEAFLQCVKQY